MRKRAALLCGTFLLLATAGAWAGVSVKLTGGLNYLLDGDYSRSLRGAYDALRDAAGDLEGSFRPFRLDLCGGLEVLIPVANNLEIGIGAGYESMSLENRFRYFWLFVTLEDAFDSKLSVIPITLNLHTSIPLADRLGLDLFGGAGYYLVDFRHRQSLGTDFFAYADSREFSVRKGTLGFQGGAALEWALGPGLALVLQADGRLLRLRELTGDLADTTNWFLGQSVDRTPEAKFWAYDLIVGTQAYPAGTFSADEPAEPSFFNVRAAGLDLSGFGISAGLRLRF